jgi:hypothetical protein
MDPNHPARRKWSLAIVFLDRLRVLKFVLAFGASLRYNAAFNPNKPEMSWGYLWGFCARFVRKMQWFCIRNVWCGI